MDCLSGAAPVAGSGAGADGVARAVLREIARMLDALALEPGFADAIDLQSLPMTETQREGLRQRLGQGEIEAAFDIAGPTRITETAYSGVWWVRHGDAGKHTLLEQIVVAQVPALLRAHPADIAHATRRLALELEADPGRETLDA